MTMLDAFDDALVQSMRAEIADELSLSVRRMADAGQRLDSDDEEMLARQLIAQRLERLASDAIASGRPVLSQAEEEVVTRAVFDRLFHLGRLQPLLDDESIQNVVANGHDRVFIEYAGGLKVEGPPVAESNDELVEQLREIGRRYGLSEREFNPSRPQLNLQLPDGSRLFAVAWVCARPSVSIRRSNRRERSTLSALVLFFSCDFSSWQETTRPVGRCVIRTAESVVFTDCPPGPEERKTSIRRSCGSISTSTSWASGSTATVAADVWMRPWLSVSGTRCTRCTPDSKRRRP